MYIIPLKPAKKTKGFQQTCLRPQSHDSIRKAALHFLNLSWWKETKTTTCFESKPIVKGFEKNFSMSQKFGINFYLSVCLFWCLFCVCFFKPFAGDFAGPSRPMYSHPWWSPPLRWSPVRAISIAGDLRPLHCHTQNHVVGFRVKPAVLRSTNYLVTWCFFFATHEWKICASQMEKTISQSRGENKNMFERLSQFWYCRNLSSLCDLMSSCMILRNP